MSLFTELQNKIIENPEDMGSYRKILKKKWETEDEKEKREKAEWKALCEQKKKEMSKEEYEKWRRKEWGQRNKKHLAEKQLQRYYRLKAEQQEMIEEIYKTVYDPLPEPINYDKYYTQKFREDDMTKEWKYRFCWRSSKIVFEDRKKMPRRRNPVRIYPRRWIGAAIWTLTREETKAYLYLKPHLPELMDARFTTKKQQTITKYPLRNVRWKLAKLTEASDIAPSHICNVLSAIQRDVYIASEVYLGRNSFILGDVIVTQTGQMFQICLENNLPWLTPDTVEDIHEQRMIWWKKKWRVPPPLYMLQDAYLLTFKMNERETYYYVVPYKGFNSKKKKK